MDSITERSPAEVVPKAQAARRIVRRKGLELVVERIRPGATPRVIAFFGADDLKLGHIRCPYCERSHSHWLPTVQPLYLKASCSPAEEPQFYCVVPMTMSIARRIFPEILGA